MRVWPRLPYIPTACAACPIRSVGVCRPFAEDRLDIVERFKSGDRILRAGAHLYRDGDNCTELYNVLDGWIVLYRIVESGRRQILDFALNGRFLGYQADLGGPMTHSAECLTDTSVCVFPRRAFASLMNEIPPLSLRVSELTSMELLRAHDQLVNVGVRPARARIAHLLLDLYHRLKERGFLEDNGEAEIPLTQNHIADSLGLTNVYVSQVLKQLREEKRLDFRNGRLWVSDYETLTDLIDFDLLRVV